MRVGCEGEREGDEEGGRVGGGGGGGGGWHRAAHHTQQHRAARPTHTPAVVGGVAADGGGVLLEQRLELCRRARLTEERLDRVEARPQPAQLPACDELRFVLERGHEDDHAVGHRLRHPEQGLPQLVDQRQLATAAEGEGERAAARARLDCERQHVLRRYDVPEGVRAEAAGRQCAEELLLQVSEGPGWWGKGGAAQYAGEECGDH